MSRGTPAAITERYTLEQGIVFLTGVQALVRLPLDQRRLDIRNGLDTGLLISGYPGSPLGGYDLELERRRALLGELGIVHRPGVNEDLAATAVAGSQLTHTLPGARHEGVVGIWYGKAPGLDRSADALRHGNYTGVGRTGGVLALVGDDPTAKSSTLPSASEATLAALQMPVLYPGDAQEVLDLGLHGIAMSRCSGLWTGFKVAVNVADGWSSVEVSPDRVAPIMVEASLDGQPYEHRPASRFSVENIRRMEHSLVYARLDAAVAYARANDLNRVVRRAPHDRIGIVAGGKAYVDVRQALADLGLDDADLDRLGIRLLQLRLLFPLDRELVRDFARDLDEIVVVEDKQPFLERLVKEALYDLPERPAVVGKDDALGAPLAARDGELDADAVARLVGGRLLLRADIPSARERLDVLAGRTPVARPLPMTRLPYFCSGCPHSTSVRAPDGALVGAGIGCHGMVQFMREEDGVGNVLGLTQMGGEGAQWIGQAPFTDDRHIFQNIGDGTFHHSGSLAVRAAVAAGESITFKLLWNSAVAMTGAQQATGGMTISSVAAELLAEGVKRIIVTTDDKARWADTSRPPGVELWDRERIVEAQEALAAEVGVTVLIHDQECAAEKRRKRKRGTLAEATRRAFINEAVCEGCGDCGAKSNCLSVRPVDTEFGRKTQIHQASCNKDMTCLEGDCPSFLVVVPGDAAPKAARAPDLDDADLPSPPTADVDADFHVRLCGIGGTGVVTAAQVLAVAGMLDGRHVQGMDQTGLAQKGGPVISDVRLSRAVAARAGKLSSASCDLYLVADLLAGGEQRNLAVADPGRTIGVVSTSRVPTGEMVVDPTAVYPDEAALVEGVLGSCRRDVSVTVDAALAAERLLGTNLVANMVLAGAAYQAGALPIPAAAIEQAIELNGASAALNVQAFRRGRQAVADPDAFAAAIAGGPTSDGDADPLSPREERVAAIVRAPEGSELEHLIRSRVPELAAYQDLGYAERYARMIERVRAAEQARAAGRSELATAAAFGLFKLMAYKDEYEVARLHLCERQRAALAADFGEGARYAYRLHPPLLRALGYRRKIEVGPWFDHVFRLLRPLRRLRGSWFDPFGHADVRRVERALVAEYEAVLAGLCERVDARNHAIAVEIAGLPDLVRGYEEIKLRNVTRYRERLASLTAMLSEEPAEAASVSA